MLPLYGQAILPELQAKFDLKGRAGHVRRLLLMHRLDREGARAYVQRALDEGSKEVRIAAIDCLGDSPTTCRSCWNRRKRRQRTCARRP